MGRPCRAFVRRSGARLSGAAALLRAAKPHRSPTRRFHHGSEDDIEDICKEISALAGCRSEHITRYYGSVMRPGSSELLILMELLACSVADLVSAAAAGVRCGAHGSRGGGRSAAWGFQ